MPTFKPTKTQMVRGIAQYDSIRAIADEGKREQALFNAIRAYLPMRDFPPESTDAALLDFVRVLRSRLP